MEPHSIYRTNDGAILVQELRPAISLGRRELSSVWIPREDKSQEAITMPANPLTPERIAEIEARLNAATPGPWRWGAGRSEVLCEDGIIAADGSAVFVNCGRGSGEPSCDDADFIAHAPDDIRDLLAELQAAREREGKLREALEKIIEMNRQHAEDQYGDANKAESWACIVVSRAALEPLPAPPQTGE